MPMNALMRRQTLQMLFEPLRHNPATGIIVCTSLRCKSCRSSQSFETCRVRRSTNNSYFTANGLLFCISGDELRLTNNLKSWIVGIHVRKSISKLLLRPAQRDGPRWSSVPAQTLSLLRWRIGRRIRKLEAQEVVVKRRAYLRSRRRQRRKARIFCINDAFFYSLRAKKN